MQLLNNPSLKYKAPGSFEETRYEKLHNVICDALQKVPYSSPIVLLDLFLKNKKTRKCAY